jgi:hypothetical protein
MLRIRTFACLLPSVLVLAWGAAPAAGAAEHNPLLPQPQQVRYGTGSLRLPGLSIRVASEANAEDRFAAEQLAAALSSRAGTSIPLTEKPTPGRSIVLTRTGSGAALPQPDEHAGQDSREAYTLTITAQGGEIRARSSAGLFFGVQTLREMVEGAGSEAALPEVEVHDWPSFPYRAVMMDMSHGPLPTEAEVKRQLDFLARWKANQYFFYSEASIELQGYSLLNPGDARFSQEQVRRIIDYARQRHIDVVPCLELYGHLHDLFRVERYSDLSALPNGGEFDPRKPGVMPVIRDWVEQLTKLFPSPFCHIGFDETYELEMTAQAENAAPGQLYLQQVKSVADLVGQHGKRVIMWGDHNIITKNPEILPGLPPGIIAVPWHNGLLESYRIYLEPFAARQIPQYASTSIYGYAQVFPDFNQSFAALTNLMADARQYHSVGLLLTLWTDDAQGSTRMSLPGVAFGMSLPWQSETLALDKFFPEYANLVYPPAVAREVAPALRDLSDAEQHLQRVLGYSTMRMFWADPLSSASLQRLKAQREDLRQVRLLSEDAQEHLQRALELKGDPETLVSLLLGSQMLDYAGMKFLYATELADYWRQMGTHPTRRQVEFYIVTEMCEEDHSLIADLRDTIAGLRDPYRAAWLEEYTPYRLRAALEKWDAEYQYWYRLQRRLRDFADSFHEGDALPPFISFNPGL